MENPGKEIVKNLKVIKKLKNHLKFFWARTATELLKLKFQD